MSTILNNLNKWATQALMSRSTSSRHTERLTQLWQSELKKRVKEGMKGGKREHERKKHKKDSLEANNHEVELCEESVG